MKTDTKQKILKLVKQKKTIRPHELGRSLSISQVALHKHLKTLMMDHQLVKLGTPPLVYYSLAQKVNKNCYNQQLDSQLSNFLNQNYLYLSPKGEFIKGVAGLYQWFINTKQKTTFNKIALEYRQVRKQASKHINSNGCINATKKLKQTFKEVFVDELFYQDFYSLPKFGKTALGILILHAKQSQDRKLIKRAVDMIAPILAKLIKAKKVDVIAFIPPSLPRKVQFLKEMEYYLHLGLPMIDLVKLKTGDVIIAQKSLAKLEERIINARETIVVNTRISYGKSILLIDDAVGSGATLNETSKKIRQNFIFDRIYAFAPVGSLKGFPVIREI